MAHIHGVDDMDKHFVIDAATREITNQSEKITLMQNDHNSERFTFEIPKEVDGHDMSLCNVVQVHYMNIDAATKAQNPGIYDVEDLQISSDDENAVIGSWLISSAATKYVGNLNFIFRFMCVAEDGSIEYVWSSAIFKGISVGQSYNNTDAVAEEYADILLQWQARIEALEQGGTGGNGNASGGSGVTDEQIAAAVENYLTENPIDGLTEEQAAEIAANTEARHEHANKDTLDNIDSLFMRKSELENEANSILAEAQGSGLFDGYSPGVNVYDIDGGHRVEIDDRDDTYSFNVMDGEDGADGQDGTSVTVASVSESTEDGGSNVVAFSDGKTLTVKNGSKGSQGEKGDKGDTGEQGIQGVQGVQGEKGEKGDTGATGANGKDGADGYTPIKGTDYFTEADKAEIVEDVVAETGIDIIPDYVITEAESVIDRVIAAQGNRTFTFAAITDMHYGNGSYTDGIKHACQAMKYIDERIKLDAVAVLGDYADSYPATEYENAIGDFKEINSVLADLRFAPNLRIQGNHDYYADHSALVHRFIQSHSDNVVWGDKAGGYFYRDFEEFKLRVICVNTTETGNANIGCSTAQFEWFVNSLDLTAKEDVAEWQILVLSHHPLDWYCIDSTYRFCYILEGYKNGASGTAGGIAYDFTGKNSATLIGNIHGHIHNLLTGYINKGNVNTSNPTAVMRMCTPEACINRANQYDGWKEDTAYNKTTDSAQDTSFVIYCIDLDTYTINAICYGAGYDRAVEYSTGEIITTYKVTNNLTNVSNSNSAATAKTGEGYTATLTATAGEITSVVVTMDGADITNTAYSDGVISIASVTGNIVITAVAEEAKATYINQIPISINTDGSIYNNVGYKADTRLNSSGTETTAAGTSVTGFIPLKDGDVVYLKNVNYQPDVTQDTCYIVLYDSSFTKLATMKPTQLETCSYIISNITTDENTGYITSFEVVWGPANLPDGYMRISAIGLDDTAIITVNEPIE